MIKFSIVIPTYNRKEILGRAIQSIIDQNFIDWEIIIVDDSKENHEDSIKVLGESRIKYIHRGEKLGVGSARNKGVEHSTGNYIIFLDDDDEVTRDYLKEFAKMISNNTKVDVVYCAMKVFHIPPREQEIVLPSKLLEQNKRGIGIVLAGAFAIKKSFFESVGGYDNRFAFSENMELFFRLSELNPVATFTDQANFIRYASLDGASKNLQNIINSNKLMLEKHADYFQLDKRVRILYIQVIGVTYLRLKKFNEARIYLWHAYRLNPLKMRSLLRLIISFIPFVSNKIYFKKPQTTKSTDSH